ncbi:MAG: formyltetrahydrofolate deformylase [Bacteroidetes bacterium]|nr:formyltetrahydrofolate deformylase [Bacteroidota bacterium]
MIIVIQCADKVGLVAIVSGLLASEQMNIISMREHVDTEQNQFFLRLEVDGPADAGMLKQKLSALLAGAFIQVNPLPEKKIIVLVTKEYHCLADILVRNHFKTLGASVQCVIGNYNLMEDICSRFDIPFYTVPHEGKTKEDFEKNILDIIAGYEADYLVLAKYMRILSPGFIEKFPSKIINIHHSFLPAFAGAHPYKKAFERGVKLIGATAHFVTNELDEGPIIAQQIIPVNHSYTAKDMVRAGKEIETAVLAKALNLVLDDRVAIFNNKTIVFE